MRKVLTIMIDIIISSLCFYLVYKTDGIREGACVFLFVFVLYIGIMHTLQFSTPQEDTADDQIKKIEPGTYLESLVSWNKNNDEKIKYGYLIVYNDYIGYHERTQNGRQTYIHTLSFPYIEKIQMIDTDKIRIKMINGNCYTFNIMDKNDPEKCKKLYDDLRLKLSTKIYKAEMAKTVS